MNKILDFFKDCLEAFSEAYKYAELDFYKLRNEVISLLDKARSKGYTDPAYCELSIEIRDAYETAVQIQTFYKKNGKFFRFKKELDLGKLVNIPYVVKQRLIAENKITIKLSDFQNLYSVRDADIMPSVEFDYLRNNAHIGGDRKSVGPIKAILSITDELFYYVVELTCTYEDNKIETRRKYFANIKNIPADVQNTILSSEDKTCILDVTH